MASSNSDAGKLRPLDRSFQRIIVDESFGKTERSKGQGDQMTLEQLRIFVAVAAQQHVTRAAAALNLTQSAVSAAVSSLEARHAVRLFDRVG
ncbi:LysR family transcriptional regulator, partial [Azospirillum brasilense]|uniref:LysR family transcriptional regulator n=1 Tax=Azospirillum brasilense TaxID=192 RepID=UPI003F664B81